MQLPALVVNEDQACSVSAQLPRLGLVPLWRKGAICLSSRHYLREG